MPYYLGIDGGGTKTTCAVGDEATLLATTTAGASNIVRVGEATSRESLHTAIRQACAAAGITPQQVRSTCFGGAGAARPELARVVREIIAQLVPTPIVVVGDMEIALEALFALGPGVVVNAGTGSFAYGRDRHGRTLRAGGWGFAIGDEGSAHWIGRSVVAALLRATDRDSKMAESRLAESLLQSWQLNSVLDLARRANSIPPPNFAALFPAAISSEDRIAQDTLKAAGKELAELAATVIERLFPGDEQVPVPVGITGGVFRHSEVVRETFYNELRRLYPRTQVNLQVVDPVEGALRMARRTASNRN
ncbi:MAG: N-acetylglucosamine kinase [Candidatus Sulfotelmatobacter sp.]